ncbi:hypothetical protein NLG97_g10533 [Lecanicillium saksenae]|uniref:Uncharacterized protein n=1 Tax=Lecanicillium saksenae TaxID=468837 RepID=A0ACC1QG45_9HYPO|nr:hypothetical protein NLG97_g10533 [Lecanicillium saksenae]
MDSPIGYVDDILTRVALLQLPHPAAALIRSYILEALDPNRAADYVASRINSTEDAQNLVSDWIYAVESLSRHGFEMPNPDATVAREISRRDGNICCVSGMPGSFWDPLVVVPVLSMPVKWRGDEDRLGALLCAFIGDRYFHWWRKYVIDCGSVDDHENRWLVRQSVAKALRLGQVRLDIAAPSNIEVNPRLIVTHARFSESIQLANLAREMAPALVPPDAPVRIHSPTFPQATSKQWKRGFALASIITSAILYVWLLFPQKLRLLAYKGLQHAGEDLYGSPTETIDLYKLPFGLYLKQNSVLECAQNELNALHIIRHSSYLPVLSCLDLVSRSYEHDDGRGNVHACDFAAFQTPANPDMSICNTLGEACREPHNSAPVGPFKDETAFSQELRFPDEPSRRGHKIVFSHADLNPRNIIVRRVECADGSKEWELSGIIGWETAGYYPEYWDCTKAFVEGSRWPKRHNVVMKRVFAAFGDYEAEIDVERRSWKSGDGV